MLVIGEAILILFHVSDATQVLTFFGGAVFTGITVWDTYRMKKVMTMTDGQPVEQECWAICFALQLYLDFINIFLYFLHTLQENASDR